MINVCDPGIPDLSQLIYILVGPDKTQKGFREADWMKPKEEATDARRACKMTQDFLRVIPRIFLPRTHWTLVQSCNQKKG